MFKVKMEGTDNIIEFLKLPVLVGLKITITYDFGFRKTTGIILKNENNWLTIQIPQDTFHIAKDAILSLELSKSDYNFVTSFEIRTNYNFELDDIVEIVNVDGLNRVMDCKKGNKELIGLQGKIIMIDKVSCSSIAYYLIELPIKYPRIEDMKYIIDGRTLFLGENLKLIKRGNDVKMDKKEQLLSKLEQIKKEFNKKIESVQNQIEEHNKKDCKNPKYGENYYTITETGINQYEWTNEAFDGRCLDELNCFKTREQAERQAFEQLLHRKLKRFAELNNEEEIDWNNSNQAKYYLFYLKGKFEYNYDYLGNKGLVYFTSKQVIDKAIAEFKDELIRYFTSDK